MMDSEELRLLSSPTVRQAIDEACERDPLEVALDAHVPHARLVATQVKYRQRARHKLPSFAAAGCIFPPRAFEQASSEACACCKRIEGETVLDLTCGLGVDAWALSRRFRRVTTLERDPVLAAVAAENFARLGITNIEVVNSSAEDFLQRSGLRFDWIYADPDRRSADGRKLVRMEDCSPDVVALLPQLRAAAPKLCVKNSPLFDIDEAPRIFGPCRVEVLSVGDECKEVVVYADDAAPQVIATAVGRGSFAAQLEAPVPPPSQRFEPSRYRWLAVPDVALRKARLARLRLAGKADIWSDNGFGFAAEPFDDPLVRLLPVEEFMPYEPRKLKKRFGGTPTDLIKRDFPIAQEETMRRLGLRAGNDLRLACTKIGTEYWVVRLK
ncbi:MAG: class I SAM-dependent methyltransferase [Alistipes sp.]|nr:class I SAM-dependent methyltransferase [Alistipes sp.]